MKYRNGRPLTETGHLAGSITSNSTADTAVVGTNVHYAPYHQFGTSPYIISVLAGCALQQVRETD